ncbi:glycoside hydrolase family 15 protein [Paenibacillus doosanensis]|uniref:glycoside hydrolase family 15 protein n=1 Tax=Paenibacillus doosanensis TaxID=1229154 RepID=UPI00218038CD|nr:glycoside hydrolase family 15 protein [Paenibacillus doosanensis]MCS7463448.1 glycoside hydrolase family 15 protein [Paenibacillus doosanensis]
MTNKLTIHELAEISKQIIRYNQHSSGGYIACPLFVHYGFSWLRDGSFIANAMDTAGETASSELFHGWVNRVVARQKDHIEQLLQRHVRGEAIGEHEFLHTRYHLDGRDDKNSEWGHFQLDGYGTWLWGLAEHLRAAGASALPDTYKVSAELTVRYLCAFWKLPNFDCWEERNDQVHPSTLACIYGGLSAIEPYLEIPGITETIHNIRQFLLERCVHPESGHIVKSLRPVPGEDRYEFVHDGVDASLMWLCRPFGVFAADDPVMAATIQKIRTDLRTPQGGVRRFPGDEYYGGGEWILLTAWLGWIETELNRRDEAEAALAWIARQADELGRLPEQVPNALLSMDTYEGWVNRWGPPASPLLWSHAMYLVLYSQLYR